MTSMLLPAGAVVVSAAVLVAACARLRGELVQLRRSLRRLPAAAVAGDELVRSLRRLGRQAAGLRSGAPRRPRRAATRDAAR